MKMCQCQSRLVSWNILMISEGKRYEGCILGSEVIKKQTEWRKKLELIAGLRWKYGWWLWSWAPALYSGKNLPGSWGVCEQQQGSLWTSEWVQKLHSLSTSSPCTYDWVLAADGAPCSYNIPDVLDSCGPDDTFLKTNRRLLSGVTRASLVYEWPFSKTVTPYPAVVVYTYTYLPVVLGLLPGHKACFMLTHFYTIHSGFKLVFPKILGTSSCSTSM